MSFWSLIAVPALLAALGLSARFTFWRPDMDGVPILMYHYLTDDLSGTRHKQLRVSPAAFARQIAFLAGRGYRTVGLEDFYQYAANGRPLPEKPVILTFDDGGRESVFRAREILARHGFTATVLVVTDQLGGTNAWDRPKKEPEIDLVNFEDIRELIDSGWEVGSHTKTHADLTALTDGELTEELAGSKAALESRLDREITAVAYPYGLADQRVRQAARAAGYRLGLTTRWGKNSPNSDLFDLKRISIKRRDIGLDLSLKLKKGRSTV